MNSKRSVKLASSWRSVTSRVSHSLSYKSDITQDSSARMTEIGYELDFLCQGLGFFPLVSFLVFMNVSIMFAFFPFISVVKAEMFPQELLLMLASPIPRSSTFISAVMLVFR